MRPAATAIDAAALRKSAGGGGGSGGESEEGTTPSMAPVMAPKCATPGFKGAPGAEAATKGTTELLA